MKLRATLPVEVPEQLPWHQAALRATADSLRSMADVADFPVLMASSAPGCGLECFADSLTARLCCQSPAEDGAPCGQCRGCQQWLAGTHPDVLTLHAPPEQEISVEAARECIERLQLVRHYLGLRVVRIAMTEQLTRSAANALLKTLEEPPARTVFLLLSLQPRAIMPTIRSRAQALHLAPPDEAQTTRWLEGLGIEKAAVCSARYPGQPLRALASAGADDEVDFAMIADAWRRNPADIDAVVKKLSTSRELAFAFVDWLAAQSWRDARQRLAAEAEVPGAVDEAQERFRLVQQCRSSLQAYTPPALALEALFVSWRALLAGGRAATRQ